MSCMKYFWVSILAIFMSDNFMLGLLNTNMQLISTAFTMVVLDHNYIVKCNMNRTIKNNNFYRSKSHVSYPNCLKEIKN